MNIKHKKYVFWLCILYSLCVVCVLVFLLFLFKKWQILWICKVKFFPILFIFDTRYLMPLWIYHKHLLSALPSIKVARILTLLLLPPILNFWHAVKVRMFYSFYLYICSIKIKGKWLKQSKDVFVQNTTLNAMWYKLWVWPQHLIILDALDKFECTSCLEDI